MVRGFGVKLAEGKQDDNDLACAVALFLFGDDGQELPCGYSTNKLDDMSPIRQVASFPQELVLLGRATVLLKGIAKRLDVPFSLAEKWGAGCALTIDAASEPVLPLWGKEVAAAAAAASDTDDKIRLRHVVSLLKKCGKGKGKRFLERVVKKLPPDLRTRVLEAELERQERKEAEKRDVDNGASCDEAFKSKLETSHCWTKELCHTQANDESCADERER